MKLADLIDLEAGLAQDAHADPEALARRDRSLGADQPASADRHRRLTAWVRARREREPEGVWPGRPAARGLGWLRFLAAVVGLGVGWGTAEGLLAYDGRHPVNVLNVVAVLVLGQLALLGLLLLSGLLPRALRGLPGLGGLRRGLGDVLVRLARAGGLPESRRVAWEAVWHRLRARRSLYSAVEPWLLLRLTQGFAVAFNLGALAAYLRGVAFSDLAFAWSTTLEVSPEALHRWLGTLAAPWGWAWPDAVPTEALVRLTRYTRLEAAYLGATGGRAPAPSVVGGWWPFLVAATAVYGLLPRLLLLGLADAMTRRRLATLPLDDAAVQPLLDRLTAPRLSTRGMAEGDLGDAPQAEGPTPLGEVTGYDGCVGILWRGDPRGAVAARQALATRLGCPPAALLRADGRDPEADGAVTAQAGGQAGPVVILVESFEPPDKAFLGFLSRLRAAVGPRRRTLVLLGAPEGERIAPPAPADEGVWSHALGRLEDPYLGVASVTAQEVA